MFKPVNTAAAVTLFIITAALFFGLFDAQFINYDDLMYVTNNPLVKDLSAGGILNIFTSFHHGLYKPLVLLSFAADFYLFGLNGAPYHVINVLFHALNTVLLFALIWQISKKTEVSFITALLFAAHPMHVESVAWIAERKDVMYAFFLLLSSNFYVNYLNNAKKTFYWASFAMFALSLLCKPAGILFGFVLILFDYIKGKTVNAKTALKYQLPFFVLAGLAGFINLFALSGMQFYKPENYWALSYAGAGFYSFLLYIKHLFAFNNLSIIYPFPEYNSLLLKISPFIALGLIAGGLYFARKNKIALFGFLFFVIMLLPALPFKPSSPNIAFDHYSYLPYIGLFYIFAEALFWVLNKLQNKKTLQTFVIVAFSFVLLGLAKATINRVSHWHNAVTLWSAAIEVNPLLVQPYISRGVAYLMEGDLPYAKLDFYKALELEPSSWSAYGNLGALYFNEGDLDKAEESFKQALNFNPQMHGAYTMLAQIYLAGQKITLAREAAAKAVDLNEADSSVYIVMGRLAQEDGNFGLALENYNKAVSLDPGNYYSYYYIAKLYEERGEIQNACVNYATALQHNPMFEAALRSFESLCVPKESPPIPEAGETI